MERDDNENNRTQSRPKRDAAKQKTDSSTVYNNSQQNNHRQQTNNNNAHAINSDGQQQQQQITSKRNNKKPEMARYQPPGNRSNKTLEKPPTPPLVENRPKSSSALKKKDTFKQDTLSVNQTDLDYTRKSPGSKETHLNHQTNSNFLSNRVDENEPIPARIPISIIKTNFKGGILKLNSATLNEMNSSKKVKNDTNENYFNENIDHLNRHSLQNHNENTNDTNLSYNNNRGEANSNYKMLFDPNNPNKPIYVKEKPSKTTSADKATANQQANTYRRRRSESRKQNEGNNDTQAESDQSKQNVSNPPNTKVNNDIIKVQGIIQAIKPLEQSLSNLIDSIDIKNQSIQAFNANIMPIRKKLEQLCIDATFTHIETASFSNIDLNHWRSCYHHLIETLRKELSNQTNQYDANGKIINTISVELKTYIADGNRFYTKFVEKLEEYFLKFKSNDLANLNYLNSLDSIKTACHIDMTIKTKNMKLALMCINRCWIAMGDLARYEEMIFATSSSTPTFSMISSESPSSSNCSSVDSSVSKSAIQRDYSLARYYYLKAMSLAPKSSRAYHQLAILAVYTKRRLDACYYYFRCLEVNIPLSSVKQALNSLFDEARVKSDAISKFINNAIINKQKNSHKTDKSESTHHRNETWFKPSVFNSIGAEIAVRNKPKSKQITKAANLSIESDRPREDSSDTDSTEEDEETSEDENEVDNDANNKKLSTTELNKRFMHNYLNTIGKMFTKVGMETYHEVCSRMLHEFKELLRRKPCPLQKMRLLQITVINISLIDLLFKSHENQIKKSNKQDIDHFIQRSQLVESAVQLSIDMFVLISKRFTYLLSNYYEKNPQEFLADETEPEEKKTWRQLFPSIKIFIDWMLCNSKLWQPLPDQLPPDLGPNLNRWQIIADMLNLVYDILNSSTQWTNKCDIISGKIKLEEDLELVGFVPLLSLPCEFDPKVDQTLDLSFLTEFKIMQVRDKKRMEKLCLFADYLCGLEQPYLKYDVTKKCYLPILKPVCINKQIKTILASNRTTSICSNNSSTSSFKSNDIDLMSNNLDDLNLADSDYDQEEEYGSEENSTDFNQLRQRHRVLKAKITEQEKQNQNVLDTSLQRRIELEIRPKFVVPDTNCFIDHLDLIEKILTSNYYILIVPLLVINELEKLSKSISNCNDDSLEHAQYVQRSAKKSIQFLNDKFDKRDRNIKAITSQGSILETIQFRSEELKAKGTNDELILGCCLHFVHDNARDFNKTDRIHLYREVVLLTEDRHLRMKSHTRNLPCKTIYHFCRWSNLLVEKNRRNSQSNNTMFSTTVPAMRTLKKIIPNRKNSRYE